MLSQEHLQLGYRDSICWRTCILIFQSIGGIVMWQN